jgi:transposase
MKRFSVGRKWVNEDALGPLTPVIDAILAADRSAPIKQRHTAKRIFERLRAEHGYAGGYTVVKDYVRLQRTRMKEAFVPLAHPPGHAQVDFGQCIGIIGGVRTVMHVFCFDLPHSDAPFVKAYPAETTEAFLDGHVSAFAFFGGVPLSILYDNTKLAVARILGDGQRTRIRASTELISHFLFRDRFGRPGKGNDKGKVEGLVKYTQRTFMTPLPHAASFEALNAALAERCRARQGEHAGRHQRLRPLVSEHPGPIHPRVGLVIDAGAPHRLISGGHRARHEQVPPRSCPIAVHLDVTIQAVVDREGEDP